MKPRDDFGPASEGSAWQPENKWADRKQRRLAEAARLAKEAARKVTRRASRD